MTNPSIQTMLITGAAGMLGQWMEKEFVCDGNYSVRSLGHRSELDLTDAGRLEKFLRDLKPDIVIHCAAITNLELCESDPNLAHALHVLATSLLGQHCSRLIYISTDSVFDGRKGNYSETDPVKPLNHYAKTKLEGENAALESCKNALVIRTNLFGKEGGNSLVKWAVNELQKGNSITGYKDVHFNPVHVRQAAQFTGMLIQKDVKGIVNLASDQALSKYDFLCMVSDALGFDTRLINPGDANSLVQKIPKPPDSTLNTGLLNKILGQIPSLAEGLQYLQEEYGKIH